MNPPLRDPLLPPSSGEERGTEECERCGAIIARRGALRHLNWHEALASALRGKPPRK